MSEVRASLQQYGRRLGAGYTRYAANYDSCVNSMSNPEIRVLFDDASVPHQAQTHIEP